MTGIVALLVLQASGQVLPDDAATGAVQLAGRHSLNFVSKAGEFVETVALTVKT